MPEPPPRQHKHERQHTPSTHPVIPTRRIWNDEYDGQKIVGDFGGLKFPDICLTGEEKPRKKPHPGNLSRPGIEPGPAAWQARMLPLAPQRWTDIYNVPMIKYSVIIFHEGYKHLVAVDLGLTMILTSQVISVAFYSEREKSDKFCSEDLISAWGSFTCRKSTTRDPRLLLFRRKSYSGFLRSENIHRPQPGSNPRTSDPEASMITTVPPGSTRDHSRG